MNFDLTDLRLFLLAAHERSLTRAAAGRHLSLSAASARIKALEKQAGTPLLHRDARGVHLTMAGETFAGHARAMLENVERLEADLGEYREGLRGHVRIFGGSTAVTEYLPEILSEFLSRHPQLSVDLQERPMDEIAPAVASARVELGIVTGEPGDWAGLRAIHFSTDRLVLVVPRHHRLAGAPHVFLADTLDEPAVGMRTDKLQRLLTHAAEAAGRLDKLRVECESYDALCRMVSMGVGVGIVPQSAAQRHVKTMGLAQVPLEDAWSLRKRFMLLREDEEPAPHTQRLVDAIEAHFRRAPLPQERTAGAWEGSPISLP